MMPFVVPIATTSLLAQSKDQHAVSTISIRITGSAKCTARESGSELTLQHLTNHTQVLHRLWGSLGRNTPRTFHLRMSLRQIRVFWRARRAQAKDTISDHRPVLTRCITLCRSSCPLNYRPIFVYTPVQVSAHVRRRRERDSSLGMVRRQGIAYNCGLGVGDP